jgi:hypothetical protein
MLGHGHKMTYLGTKNERRNPEVGDSRGADISQRTRSTVWFQMQQLWGSGVPQHASGLGKPNRKHLAPPPPETVPPTEVNF